jgi:hypothetical protein
MTAFTIIWALLIVPAFGLFQYLAFRWADEDPQDMTQNDKSALYCACAFMALGWPIIFIFFAFVGLKFYMDGPHG